MSVLKMSPDLQRNATRFLDEWAASKRAEFKETSVFAL
jgi:hypothetical protein